MLFSKDTPRVCMYCVHARDYTEAELLCDKRGPVACDFKCRRFEYDPLRRTPAPPVKPRLGVKEEDFRL